MKKTFLSGPAGTGKTTAGIDYLLNLSANTYDGILVYVPQKVLAVPYVDALRDQRSALIEIFTIGSLSRRMVELFWPLVAEDAGFRYPEQPPVFLNLEGAQFFMAQVLIPLLDEGLFESVTITRNRLYTQVLDNLNKAALNGYRYQDIISRLKLAVVGDSEQQRIYEDAQIAANQFRGFCLDNNLLDFSLQLEIFWRFLWQPGGMGRDYLETMYQHVLVDNVEETTPIEHEVIRSWLPDLDSALIIYDIDAGYRTFLGADPLSAYELRKDCESHIRFEKFFHSNPFLENVSDRVGKILKRPARRENEEISLNDIQEAIVIGTHRFFPDMLDWVADSVAELVERQAVPKSDIVILAPFLSDALRYSMTERLDRFGISTRTHRPSRSLRDEPVSQALLTLSLLAHPQWDMTPSKFDVAYMLVQILGEIDLVRAQILSEIVYRSKDGRPALSSFHKIIPEMQERITFTVGENYEYLRVWLDRYIQGNDMELDFFLGRIFGEVLSQPGFGFHQQYSAGEITSNLIDSIKNFRLATHGRLYSDISWGKEYIQMVQEGVIAAQYLRSWKDEGLEEVKLLPAYTFLMQNQAVDYQFWLDIGSYGWHKRIYQPVTHPFVLNRNWPPDRYWTDSDEVEEEQKALYRLVSGLMRRCRKNVYLGLSNLSESGYENDGLLLRTFQRIYQQIVSEVTP